LGIEEFSEIRKKIAPADQPPDIELAQFLKSTELLF